MTTMTTMTGQAERLDAGYDEPEGPAAAGEEAAPARWWALTPVGLAVAAAACLAFLLLCYLPLRPTGLWGHLTYGDWILAHRALPAEDPVLPLAEGMPVVDGSWLSQVILALTWRAGGAGLTSTLLALTLLATALILLRTLRRRTGSLLWALLGLAAVWALSRGPGSPWTAFGPASFGALCFAVLLAAIAAIAAVTAVGAVGAGEERQDVGPARPVGWLRGPWAGALGTALLFALWANLHSSFALGLAVLAGCLVGRLLDVAWESRSLGALVADRPLRRWLGRLELAALATLANPYGLDLWLHAFRQPPSDNLLALPPWQPLAVTTRGGWWLAAAVVALLSALRYGRRRMAAAHVLLLAGFGAAALARAGMLAWLAPVYALIALPYLAEAFVRLRAGRPALRLAERWHFLAAPSWHLSVVALVLAWAAFAFSPVGASLLRGIPRPAERSVVAGTPLALTANLRADPPRGLTFVPADWGDWLVREGPGGLQPFATSNVEVLPGLVWQDYLRIDGGAADWQRVLDRYGVRTVIFDRAAQHGQMQSLRYVDDWKIVYEDDLAMRFDRSKP